MGNLNKKNPLEEIQERAADTMGISLAEYQRREAMAKTGAGHSTLSSKDIAATREGVDQTIEISEEIQKLEEYDVDHIFALLRTQCVSVRNNQVQYIVFTYNRQGFRVRVEEYGNSRKLKLGPVQFAKKQVEGRKQTFDLAPKSDFWETAEVYGIDPDCLITLARGTLNKYHTEKGEGELG